MTRSVEILNEARKAARDAALFRWGTGSADTTQMLLSVDAALEAALPYLAPSGRCQQFVHTAEEKDWFCVCGHPAEDHGMSPSQPGGACTKCAPAAPAVVTTAEVYKEARLVVSEALADRREELTGEASARDFDGATQVIRALEKAGMIVVAAPAVPQPVDREALRMVLINYGIDVKMDTKGASEMVDAAVDAVLALLGGSVLAGEQEQVAPE